MARPSTGANLSITQLQQILNDRSSSLKRLEKQRKGLLKKLDGIDRDLEKLGGAPGARGTGGRAHNEKSLPETLDQVLRSAGKPMRIAEITQAVLATRYRSTSASFRAIVNPT